MGASEHPVFFRVLKICIVLVAIVCGILEAVEYYAWTNYVDSVNGSGSYSNFKLDKSKYFQTLNLSYGGQVHGQIKIWYYVVIIITVVGTTFYLSSFQRVWDYGIRLLLIEIFPDEALLLCRMAVSSIAISWFNVLLSLVSLLMAWKRSIELASIMAINRMPSSLESGPNQRVIVGKNHHSTTNQTSYF
ncbi:5064_t:CDS:2 [Acaulospora morrowiae]|uniref:5064_t:CDS:1 n=1 Tax=Acaulospora morrowiae TaxID=94023 RepID=A0A9N8W9T2_9GLOM|nr:5064_t:CDS:2 [Acaulospora morrowiae]